MNLTLPELQALIKTCNEQNVADLKLGDLEVHFDNRKRRDTALSAPQAAQAALVEELVEQQEVADAWFSAEPPLSPEI